MKGSKPRIVVVGSLVTDLVFRVGHRPREGETLLGDGFDMFLGGKGFNQAVGCRRLGAEVTLVGRIGRDWFGKQFLDKLYEEEMYTRHIVRDDEAGTGVASPVVFADGQNSIINVPRANMRLTPEDVEAAETAIVRADVLMLQYEVNPMASKRAAELARRSDTTIILDPAPVHDNCDEWEWPIDYLVPNEIEANMLAEGNTPEEWARELHDDECRGVVISLGPGGALAMDDAGPREHPGYRVKPVDTTGAGDAFRAGLAVMLAREKSLDEAVKFANGCGALACLKMGAEPSMPRADAVATFTANNEPVPLED